MRINILELAFNNNGKYTNVSLVGSVEHGTESRPLFVCAEVKKESGKWVIPEASAEHCMSWLQRYFPEALEFLKCHGYELRFKERLLETLRNWLSSDERKRSFKVGLDHNSVGNPTGLPQRLQRPALFEIHAVDRDTAQYRLLNTYIAKKGSWVDGEFVERVCEALERAKAKLSYFTPHEYPRAVYNRNGLLFDVTSQLYDLLRQYEKGHFVALGFHWEIDQSRFVGVVPETDGDELLEAVAVYGWKAA